MTVESKLELARNPNTPPEILEKMFNRSEWLLGRIVLLNPSTPK